MGTEIRFTKWDGSLHWHYTLEPLGTDRYGMWLGGRAGIELRRGREEPVLQPHDVVALVPPDAGWIGHWNGPDSLFAVYVDVTTTPVVAGGVVHAVDLDLDVIRMLDGTVRLLDEDEFAEHRVRYGYPAEVAASALATADDLIERLTARAEPFGDVGDAWLSAYLG